MNIGTKFMHNKVIQSRIAPRLRSIKLSSLILAPYFHAIAFLLMSLTLFVIVFGQSAHSAPTSDDPKSPLLSNYCKEPENKTKQVCVWTTDKAVPTCSLSQTVRECEGARTVSGFCEFPEYNGTKSSVCKNSPPDGEKCNKSDTVEACRKKIAKVNKSISPEVIYAFVLGLLAFLVAATGSLAIIVRNLRGLNIDLKKREIERQEKVDSFKTRLLDPTLNDKDVEFASKGLNVVLLGTGASGKTSIIRALTGIGIAKPVATEGLDLYTLTQEVYVRTANGRDKVRRLLRVYIEDMRGQSLYKRNFQDFITQSKRLKKREELIPHTVFVIVVDLFPIKREQKFFAEIDQARTKKQIEFFQNKDNLKNIKRLSNSNEVAVCLFINKVDMLSTLKESDYRAIKKHYDPAFDAIKEVFTHVDHYLTLGAATKGWGVSGADKLNMDAEHKTLFEIFVEHAGNIKLKDEKSVS